MGETKKEALLTAKVFKDRYLFGVDLRDADGNVMSDQIISDKINAATCEIEEELDLSITPVVYSASDDTQEKRDFRAQDFFNWSYIKLNHYPVIEVKSMKLIFPSNTELIEYPVEWFKIYKESGILQLVPTASTIPSFFTKSGFFLPEIILAKQMVPQMIEVEYTAGFAQDKVPFTLNHAIGLKAAIDILSIFGDLVIGAGIASQSIGMDGLSQSVATTASAMFGAYSARMRDYTERLEKLMKNLRKFYKGIAFVTI